MFFRIFFQRDLEDESIGFVSVFISLFIGVILGSISGYYSGLPDKIIMWLINVTWSIPTLLLVIAITLALGKGFWQVFIAVGLTMWVEVARIVRGQVKQYKERQFVIAAKVFPGGQGEDKVSLMIAYFGLGNT